MQRIRFSRYTEGYIERMKLSSHARPQLQSSPQLAARVAINMECGAPAPLSLSSPRHPNAHQLHKTNPLETNRCIAR